MSRSRRRTRPVHLPSGRVSRIVLAVVLVVLIVAYLVYRVLHH
ncbi:MAG: hypothetical protein P4L93_00850 [Coriobacteriia bacterium]|nr:hypothetical protein [Coriobacteriia bacterium]